MDERVGESRGGVRSHPHQGFPAGWAAMLSRSGGDMALAVDVVPHPPNVMRVRVSSAELAPLTPSAVSGAVSVDAGHRTGS